VSGLPLTRCGLTLEARVGTRSPTILSTGQLFGGARSLKHTSSLGGGKLKSLRNYISCIDHLCMFGGN
jgi:hypothetical protein